MADRTNRASIGIFQQQSFLVGVSSADRTDTHGLSEDLFAVDGSIGPRRTDHRFPGAAVVRLRLPIERKIFNSFNVGNKWRESNVLRRFAPGNDALRQRLARLVDVGGGDFGHAVAEEAV